MPCLILKPHCPVFLEDHIFAKVPIHTYDDVFLYYLPKRRKINQRPPKMVLKNISGNPWSEKQVIERALREFLLKVVDLI